MVLSALAWIDVDALDRERTVVLIPTGSLEQHGPHLPLFTDTLLASGVAAAVEKQLHDRVLLTPALWLGASGHHLAFPGSLSASFEAYEGALLSVVESLIPHGFRIFYVLNGHGGNTEPNGVALRKLKAWHPNGVFAHRGYFELVPDVFRDVMEGPFKEIKHACEAEASLMMHLHPELVRKERLRDDGLAAKGGLRPVLHFDEMTEQGSFGYATLATADKGKRIFDAAVQSICEEIKYYSEGVALEGIAPKG